MNPGKMEDIGTKRSANNRSVGVNRLIRDRQDRIFRLLDSEILHSLRSLDIFVDI